MNSAPSATFNFKSNEYNGEYFLVYNLSHESEGKIPFNSLKEHFKEYCDENNLNKNDIIFCKVFTVDIHNFNTVKENLSVHIVDKKTVQIFQPSLVADVSILIYANNSESLRNKKIKFTFNRFAENGMNIEEETSNNFQELKKYLDEKRMNLLDNTIRSWIYVNDIDDQYKYIVEKRGIFFSENNMNNSNRYLASTGIGAYINGDKKSQTDFLFIEGINDSHINRMIDHDIMPDTISYGVHFERGIELDLPDRKHYYLSGTASISADGEVVHIGDSLKQTQHAIYNCDQLLKKYKSSINDLTHCVIYVREPSDFKIVYNVVNDQMPDIPLIFVHGPVCRPTWLIELEGVAIKEPNI